MIGEPSTEVEETQETALETTLSDAETSTENKPSISESTSEFESDDEDIEIDEADSETIETDSDGNEIITTSIQYIIVTAETQSQVDYSTALTSIDDKLDTIVSCSIVVMAVIVLSWIHLISRRRRNRK